MSLISVLIPTFNQHTFIAQAIQSALDQDYPHIEVIVCDDASTDATGEATRAFENDPRVSLNFNAANLGRTKNYRKCLFELAHGEWAIVLDGDDYFCDTEYLSKAMQAALAEPDIDLVFANAVRVRDDLGGERQFRDKENHGLPAVMNGSELFMRLASNKITLFHNTCLYKRDKAMGLDFYRENIISSDWESLHRYILTGKVAFIDEGVAVWRIHGDNASKNMSAEERIANLQSVVGPYLHARSLGVFPDARLQSWFNRRLERAARKDLRSISKCGDLPGYKKYMSHIQDINPAVFQRLQTSPRLFLRKLQARLKKSAID
jgi:glycosyltransferase involved in cell wall biosynthesis